MYYPVNSGLVQQMVASMQRLGLAQNTNREQKRLAVDVAEVLIKWEMRKKTEEEKSQDPPPSIIMDVDGAAVTASGQCAGVSVTAGSCGNSSGVIIGMEKKYYDTIVNFLLCMTCQVSCN